MFQNHILIKDNEFIEMFSTDRSVLLYTIYDTTAHLVSHEIAKNAASFCFCSMDWISVSISDMCNIPCFSDTF